MIMVVLCAAGTGFYVGQRGRKSARSDTDHWFDRGDWYNLRN
jgi:hypothetical protein